MTYLYSLALIFILAFNQNNYATNQKPLINLSYSQVVDRLNTWEASKVISSKEQQEAFDSLNSKEKQDFYWLISQASKKAYAPLSIIIACCTFAFFNTFCWLKLPCCSELDEL